VDERPFGERLPAASHRQRHLEHVAHVSETERGVDEALALVLEEDPAAVHVRSRRWHIARGEGAQGVDVREGVG
jgi:hypothetical protein